MKRPLLVIVLCGVVGLGWVPWPAQGAAQWVCRRLEERSGWRLSVSKTRWVPWRGLELVDLKLRTLQGGKLHVSDVHIRPFLPSLLLGRLTTRWTFDDVRIDPGSWGIRTPLVQELLSTSPVASNIWADLHVGLNSLRLEASSPHGPMLRFQAQGWLTRTQQVSLALDGLLARRLLEEMNLMKRTEREGPLWEPFQIRLNGALSNPDLFFTSKFYSFSSLNSHVPGGVSGTASSSRSHDSEITSGTASSSRSHVPPGANGAFSRGSFSQKQV